MLPLAHGIMFSVLDPKRVFKLLLMVGAPVFDMYSCIALACWPLVLHDSFERSMLSVFIIPQYMFMPCKQSAFLTFRSKQSLGMGKCRPATLVKDISTNITM